MLSLFLVSSKKERTYERLRGMGPLEDSLVDGALEAVERGLPAIVERAETDWERGHLSKGNTGRAQISVPCEDSWLTFP